ncbi:MAG: hypothetical protein M3R57_00700 [Chloroflexota bacterium]|nr:hypothetical protein [Chloroflexota bacterium]
MKLAGRLSLLALGALLATVACGAPIPPTPPIPPPLPDVSTTPSGEQLPSEPPTAVLNFPGGQPTAGDLGTYVYRGTGSDAPWLPGEPVAVPPAGALAQVFLSEPLRVASWSVWLALAGRKPGPGEPRQIGAGEGPITFELPSGTWTLQLQVEFGDGIGIATYYWLLGQG